MSYLTESVSLLQAEVIAELEVETGLTFNPLTETPAKFYSRCLADSTAYLRKPEGQMVAELNTDLGGSAVSHLTSRYAQLLDTLNTTLSDPGGEPTDPEWRPDVPPGGSRETANFATEEYSSVGLFDESFDATLETQFNPSLIVADEGYIPSSGDTYFKISDAAFATLDVDDFAIYVELDLSDDPLGFAQVQVFMTDDDFNFYVPFDINKNKAKTLDNEIEVTTALLQVRRVNRYAFSVRPDDNIAAINGALSAAGSDKSALLADPLTVLAVALNGIGGGSYALTKFAIVTPCPSDEEIRAWTGELTEVEFSDTPPVIDLNFRAGTYSSGGVSGSLGDFLAGGSDIPTVVGGDGWNVAQDETVTIALSSNDTRDASNSNYTLFMDVEFDDSASSLTAGVYQLPVVQQVLFNSNFGFADGQGHATDPVTGLTGRHKIAVRMHDFEATVYLDGSEIGGSPCDTYHEVVDQQTSIQFQAVGGPTGGLTVRQVRVGLPVDNATLASMTA